MDPYYKKYKNIKNYTKYMVGFKHQEQIHQEQIYK